MSIYLGKNKVNAKAPARLTDITVSASDEVQEFYVDTHYATITNSQSSVTLTGGYSTQITYSVSPSPIDNTEYRIIGTIILKDANDIILKNYNINGRFSWNTTLQNIMVDNSDPYITKILVRKNSSTSIAVRYIIQSGINGSYKIAINNASLYETTGYDGINKVTVEATPYPEMLMKNYISRSSNFTNIDWPDGLTTIGKYAFAECTTFCPSSLPSSLTSIDKYAFYNCNKLALTSLPSGIASIGDYAFFNCVHLALTSLPSGLTSIGYYAFGSCSNLVLTSLPSSITSIGDYAFYYCSHIALTSLPSGLTSIGNYTFRSCLSLVSISLPSSITRIGDYAFQCCTSLTTVECLGAITKLGTSAFLGQSGFEMSLSSVSFPNMSLSSLSAVFGSSIAANACHQLTFADIGSTEAITSAYAFTNCYALQTLVLRRSDGICSLSNITVFMNTPMRGYNSLTGTVYVPSALISTYQTATNWATLYNGGTVTFAAIEGSEYELD